MPRQSRKAERRAIDILGQRGKEIMRRCDPLGLIDIDAPDDEYDCVVTGVMVELMSERERELETWIAWHFEDHFGLEADPAAVTRAAAELIDLWNTDDLAPLRA